MNFALLNLGIGIGGIIGGLVADVDRVSTFQVMYVVEAASYLPALVLMLGPLRHAGAPVPIHHDTPTASVSYLALLRHRAVLPLVVLSFASAFVGYAQLNAGLPAYARAVSEVSTRALGWAFAANTLVIVLLQLVVLQRIEGHRRTRVVLLMSAVWGVCWLVLACTSLVPGTLVAALLLSTAAGVFALGETLLQPTIPAMVNDMAPDHLRGRYNAVTSAGFQLASVAGPPVAGFLVGHQLGSAWIGLLLVSLVGVAIIAVRWVEPSLTPTANGITAASADLTVPAEPVVPPAPQPPPA
jgi:MFS family permease